MPNHVTNILKIDASPERVAEVRAAIAGDGVPIDFERISPMPAELHVTSDGLVLLLESMTEVTPISEVVKALRRVDSEAVLDNFLQAIRNVRRYGFASWYDWSYANWGTKWNAYAQKELAADAIEFETAWRHPAPIYKAMSERFPDVRFEVKYADEDLGGNCGHFAIKGGIVEAIATFHIRSPLSLAFARDVTGSVADEEMIDGE